MVPSAFVEMVEFPLTINGKLDHKAFPDPDLQSAIEDYVSATSNIEKALVEIWQEILGLDRVSLNDDFFKIGGDSILSIQVSSRIRQAGFNCQVKEIFEHKTILKLSEHLSKKDFSTQIQSEQGILTGEIN